jgi:beta-lactamase superfamily II metal-dependent hydrolase
MLQRGKLMNSFECIIWKVQHGSAAFIRTPNDRTIMLDAGNSEDFSPALHLKNNYGLDAHTKRLDKIIISHPDRDHISDLPNVSKVLNPRILHRNNGIPDNIVYPLGTENLSEPLKTYKLMNDNYNRPLSDVEKSEPITNWGGVLVKGFSNSKENLTKCPDNSLKNNMSLVCYVKYKDTEIIFPGDLEPYGWWSLLTNTEFREYAGKATYRILIAPHHGRESGICYTKDGKKCIYNPILEVISPDLVIMSDKRGNETTVPEKYRPYVNTGLPVYSGSKKISEIKKVITTKTNNFVFIQVSENNETFPIIGIP